MIAPGSIADMALLAGTLGSLSALAVCGHLWVLRETVVPQALRSRSFDAAATAPSRVPT